MASAPVGKVVEIAPASAMAFEIDAGKSLRVVSVEGQQVGDFVAVNKVNIAERFSTGRTRSENGKVKISVGNRLYSNLCNVMFEITQDTLAYTICSTHHATGGFSRTDTKSHHMTAAKKILRRLCPHGR